MGGLRLPRAHRTSRYWAILAGVDHTPAFPNSSDRGASRFEYSLGFILLMTLASGITCELTLLFLQFSGWEERLPPLVTGVIVPASGGLIFPLVVIHAVYGQTLREFGIRWIDPGRDAWRWLAVSGTVVLLGWIVIWLLLFVLVNFGPPGTHAASPEMNPGMLQAKNPLYRLFHGADTAETVAAVVQPCLLVGFLEELFGRGLLMNALDRRYQTVWRWRRWAIRRSTVLASVLFAAWHINWLSSTLPEILESAVSALLLWPASFLLCVAYEKTRSLAVTVTLHAILDGGKLVGWYLVSLFFVR